MLKGVVELAPKVPRPVKAQIGLGDIRIKRDSIQISGTATYTSCIVGKTVDEIITIHARGSFGTKSGNYPTDDVIFGGMDSREGKPNGNKVYLNYYGRELPGTDDVFINLRAAYNDSAVAPYQIVVSQGLILSRGQTLPFHVSKEKFTFPEEGVTWVEHLIFWGVITYNKGSYFI